MASTDDRMTLLELDIPAPQHPIRGTSLSPVRAPMMPKARPGDTHIARIQECATLDALHAYSKECGDSATLTGRMFKSLPVADRARVVLAGAAQRCAIVWALIWGSMFRAMAEGASNQDMERIDGEGKARATADAAAAKTLGFEIADTVYALGTVVNSTGVSNFRSSREDWSKLPSLPELARDFSGRIANERREDKLTDATELHVLPNGRITKDRTGASHGMALTERALDGIATHVTPGGASYLKQCPADLRASNLNHWLQQATVVDARATKKVGRTVERARQLTLRTRATATGDREVYSVVGPKYAAFNVDRVAREAAAAIGGDARGELKYNGYRMTLDAMFHSNIRPENAVAGEYFKGTIRIEAADDGSGAIRCKLGLWRNLCRNLIIVDFDTVLVGSRRHVGNTGSIETDVREIMATANERIKLVVGKWSEASTEDVLQRYDLTDVDQVFRGLVLNDAVHVPGVKGDELVKRLHSAWEREPGYSKTAILNAITRAAHEYSWSGDGQEELESQAGALLYQPVWTLDTSERTAEQLLA
jgi:hypothetical protein